MATIEETDSADHQLRLCGQCFPHTEVIGQVAGRIALTYTSAADGHDEQWALVDTGGGHGDDTIIIFTGKPQPDPVEQHAAENGGETRDIPEHVWEDWDRWHKQARRETAGIMDGYGLRGAWRLVQTLIEGGYNPDQNEDAELWLYHRAGLAAEQATR